MCGVSKPEIHPLEKQHQKVGGTSEGSPRRKLREARADVIKAPEKGKSFNKEWLVNRVKRCINVK